MRYYGIDLGTTNSVISSAVVGEDGKRVAKPIVIEQYDPHTVTARRDTTLPSFVFYGAPVAADNTPSVIVGSFARSQYSIYPDRVARSIKSQMGNPSVVGLSDTVPDRTPEQISARILAHLKSHAEQNPEIRQTIDQAIITVPANFDMSKKEATLRAAELAGFSVRDAGGKWKPMTLLSEPNAVLYDIAQRYLNDGQTKESIDFSQNQRIIIFDIGGGTLDVTFQEVRQPENSRMLEISEVASARFTQLAGDDFDRLSAERLYDRFRNRMKEIDARAYADISDRRAAILARLTIAAEDLKKRINKLASSEEDTVDFLWFGIGDDKEDSVPVSVDVGNGRQYVDTITTEDYYEMIRPLLGEAFQLSDYTSPAKFMENRNNIIAPILEVLSKADRHYRSQGQELKVDKIVMNGGMSKLFWIKERLKSLFGIEPILTEDPAVSVANGAAIYASILGESAADEAQSIQIVRHIQNETLYVGLSSGARDTLIADQQELPYACTFSGYKVLPDTRRLELPVQKQVSSHQHINIAKCVIEFGETFDTAADLAFDVDFNPNGLLSIAAKVTAGRKSCIGKGSIHLDNTQPNRLHGNRILPRKGSVLHPYNELRTLRDSFHPAAVKARIADIRLGIIRHCANPADFERPVLQELQNTQTRDRYRLFLYHIANALFQHWSDAGKEELRRSAENDYRMCNSSFSCSKLDAILLRETGSLLDWLAR